jgi:hypothetical protein
VSSASVRLPASGTSIGFSELRIVQEEYRHDVAVFRVRGGTRASSYRTGAPVEVEWTQGRDTATFYGYVHHVEPTSSTDSAAPPLVWCKGASMVFENGAQTVYRYRTVPSVVGEVARAINFDVEAIGHGRVFDAITAPGGRLWDVLVKYAQEIGYSFYCHGTRIAIHPRTSLVERYASEAPVLRMGRTESLFEFTPQDGHVPVGRDRVERVISGYDPYTGRRFSVVGGPATGRLGRTMALPTGRHYEQAEASSPMEARWKLDAIAENERFNVTATATALGSPRVHQTWPVLLADVGDRYEGLWFVRKVTHRPSAAVYTMELELGRDAVNNNVAIPDARARRVLATRANPQGRPKVVYPPSVLNGGQWKAQWSSASRTFTETSARVR